MSIETKKEQVLNVVKGLTVQQALELLDDVKWLIKERVVVSLPDSSTPAQ